MANPSSAKALQIFCSLLARDPLPAQRFTDLKVRLAQLAHVAFAASCAFNEAESQWCRTADCAPQAEKDAAALWDSNVAVKVPVIPIKEVPNAAVDQPPAMRSLFDQIPKN